LVALRQRVAAVTSTTRLLLRKGVSVTIHSMNTGSLPAGQQSSINLPKEAWSWRLAGLSGAF
jgi:hypothetical protein